MSTINNISFTILLTLFALLIATSLFLRQSTKLHFLSQDLSALQDKHDALYANSTAHISRLQTKLLEKEVDNLELTQIIRAMTTDIVHKENMVKWLQEQAHEQLNNVRSEAIRLNRSMDIYRARIDDLTALFESAQAEVETCEREHGNEFQTLRTENEGLVARNTTVQEENEYLRGELRRLGSRGEGEESVPWALNWYEDVEFLEGVEVGEGVSSHSETRD
jgi:chromosome segregation ATPase